jgi:hypothetical protein
MSNNNVENFPVVDKRIIDFNEKLTDFIFEHGKNISVIAIIGALEAVKQTIIHDILDD